MKRPSINPHNNHFSIPAYFYYYFFFASQGRRGGLEAHPSVHVVGGFREDVLKTYISIEEYARLVNIPLL